MNESAPLMEIMTARKPRCEGPSLPTSASSSARFVGIISTEGAKADKSSAQLSFQRSFRLLGTGKAVFSAVSRTFVRALEKTAAISVISWNCIQWFSKKKKKVDQNWHFTSCLLQFQIFLKSILQVAEAYIIVR